MKKKDFKIFAVDWELLVKLDLLNLSTLQKTSSKKTREHPNNEMKS